MIGYLKSKGFPEIALLFVEDPQTRFNLSLEYGHISEAMKSAQVMNEPASWARLGLEAGRQGSAELMEMSLQKRKDLDGLSFHYLITGNKIKLERMLGIASKRGDAMRRFNNSLMLGNVEERVRVLAESGQVPLAYLTAKAYGMSELESELGESVADEVKKGVAKYLQEKVGKSGLLTPPISVT